MSRLHLTLLFLFTAATVSCRSAAPEAIAPSQAGATTEAELRRIDLRQAEIVQSGDVEAMAALLHPRYTAHLTNGRLSGHGQTLALVRSGALARERFQRTQEAVVVLGDTGVVMGLDRMAAPPPLADRGQLSRRYSNVYVKEGGRWRLLARHFHLLP